jgi:hypothetical protein
MSFANASLATTVVGRAEPGSELAVMTRQVVNGVA